MSTRKIRPVLRAVSAILFVLFACAASALVARAESPLEKKPGLWGTCVDEQGKPVPGVLVLLSDRRDLSSPMEAKTSEHGFSYPLLAGKDVTGREFYIGIKSDEWFIRSFHIRTRRQTGEIWQDDPEKPARLAPGQQNIIPAIKHRGFNVFVELTLMRIKDFEQGAPPAARTGQPKEIPFEQQVQELVALGDFNGAADKLSAQIETKPDDADLLWQRAAVLVKAGRAGDALVDGRKVLRLQPERKGVRVHMANWLFELGKDAEAVALLEKERELDPENPVVYASLTRAYSLAERKDDAVTAGEKWVALAPEDPEALMALAGAKAAKGDYSASEKLYRKVAERDPTNAYRIFFNLGASIRNQHGDNAAAIAAFRRAIELKPEYGKAHRELAYCLVGDPATMGEAREHFERYLALEPDDPQAQDIRQLLKTLPKK